MNSFTMFLAAAAKTTGGSSNMIIIVVYILFFVALAYFAFIRPQKKQQQSLNNITSSMEVGDSVLTTSGFYGVIIDINPDLDGGVVVVEFGSNKNCRIPMRKTAIQKLEKPDGTTIEM